jgi:hypothetical protein
MKRKAFWEIYYSEIKLLFKNNFNALKDTSQIEDKLINCTKMPYERLQSVVVFGNT